MSPITLRALVLIAAFVAGAILSFFFEQAVKNAEISQLKVTWAAEKSKADTDAIRALATANKRGDALTQRVSDLETQLQNSQEQQREIRRLTTGRPCLGAAVVRLLNQPTGAGLNAGAVPQAASVAVFEDAAAATDTDIALWADQARRSYDTCRGRLDAIAEFYAGETE